MLPGDATLALYENPVGIACGVMCRALRKAATDETNRTDWGTELAQHETVYTIERIYLLGVLD